MRTSYHKLVRDHIPAIIQEHGDACGVESMDDEAYRQALREKLIEEAQEVAESHGTVELVKELADLYEVVDALFVAYNLSPQQVLATQAQRRAERGGFQQQLRLLWTE